MNQERYSRQLRFSGIGEAGQRSIGEKHVLIIGAGALGTGNAEILVRAGIGRMTIVDRDYVEFSNLQRQQLYAESDASERLPKAIAAKRRLAAINSEVPVDAHILDVGVYELEQLASGVDLILDATDNFETRLVINDISQKHRIPWIYGACVGSYGLSYMIVPGKTPCLNCLLNAVPLGGATCDTAGIIAPTVHMVVAYQSAEALKWLSGHHGALREELVSFDLWSNQHVAIKVGAVKKDDCASCGHAPSFPYLKQEHLSKTAVLCGRDTVQIRPPYKQELDLELLASKLPGKEGKLERNPFLLSYEIGAHRLVFFRDGRVLVHGTKDVAEAKTLYHRYIG